MFILPIICEDKHNCECPGFREEKSVSSKGKGFCIFELNGYCGADARDFKQSIFYEE
jgi:hypothetical protein